MPLHLISPPPDGSHLLAGRAALERGAWEEARAHFRASLEDTETPEALEGLALAALGVSDLATTIEAHERAYAIHRERGDRRAAARLALALMFDHRSMRGDAAVGDGWLERARELLEGLGPVPERGWLLVRDADVRKMPAYDFAGVLATMAEAREIARAHGDTTLEMEVLALEGAALLRSGEVAELEALAAETGTAGMLATARSAAGELAALRGDHECARRSLEDAVDAFARAGMPYERASARLLLAQALAASGREAAALEEAARAREEFDELGAPTCVAEAAELEARIRPACGTCGPSPDAPQGPPLSRREIEVLGLVAQGMSNKEVAARLFLSEHTVKRHLANILTRLGLPSRAAAAAYAVKNELV